MFELILQKRLRKRLFLFDLFDDYSIMLWKTF